jgi:hypothetical protein
VARKDRDQTKKGMENLFASVGTDLVGSIIAGDRRRSGRGEKEGDQNYNIMTKNNVIEEEGNKTSNHTSNKTNRQASKKAGLKGIPPTKAPQASLAEGTPAKKKSSQTALLATRIEEAARMAESPTMTVTLRLPQEMNNWLDTYVHRAWPERIKKQELLVEALRLLIARRGNAHEELIETELFPLEERAR